MCQGEFNCTCRERSWQAEEEKSKNTIKKLRSRNKELKAIIMWALGENGEFPSPPERITGQMYPMYWWRIEMISRLKALGRS